MFENKKYAWCAAGSAFLLTGTADAQVMSIQPGMWEISSRVTAVEGGPPGLAGMMGKPMTIRNCVMPAQAKQGLRDLLKRGSQGKCEYKRLAITSTKFSYDMVCAGNGPPMTISASGSYTPTSYAVSSRMVMGAPKMTMISLGKGRLVGTCRR